MYSSHHRIPLHQQCRHTSSDSTTKHNSSASCNFPQRCSVLLFITAYASFGGDFLQSTTYEWPTLWKRLDSSHMLHSQNGLPLQQQHTLFERCNPGILKPPVPKHCRNTNDYRPPTPPQSTHHNNPLPVYNRAMHLPSPAKSRRVAIHRTTNHRLLRAHRIIVIFKTGAQQLAHFTIQFDTTLRYLQPK